MAKLTALSFEIGAIRPPSEGGSNSLLIRVTRNCPWKRCKFCYATFYNHEKFELRKLDDIKKDIQTVKNISEEIKNVSFQLGYNCQINDAVGSTIIHEEPGLRTSYSFINVFNWLYSGGHTVFLQDADSLILSCSELVELISYLKELFPSVNRITSYARAKTVFRKTLDEMKRINAAGLNRLHVGLETGDNELLKLVDKGVTTEEHIQAGIKIKEAGFELSEYVMPGLGGKDLSEQHALNTARTLNDINPDFIRMRPFRPFHNTPMYLDYSSGKLKLCGPYELLKELKIMITDLNVTSNVCFDHVSNYWINKSGGLLFNHSYEGYKFPEEKNFVLELIKQGLSIEESVHFEAYQLTMSGNI